MLTSQFRECFPCCATYFLHLELDSCLHFVDLLDHGLGVSQETRELTGLVQTWAQQSWNLLDERLGGEESVVLLSELLHQLLVLVELLQSFGVHEWNFKSLGFIAMLLISEDADLHLRTWDELQSEDEQDEDNEYLDQFDFKIVNEFQG